MAFANVVDSVTETRLGVTLDGTFVENVIATMLSNKGRFMMRNLCDHLSQQHEFS